MTLITIGVVGFQGDVADNMSFAEQALHDANRPGCVILVMSRGDLEKIDALVIPGGESTTIGRMSAYGDVLEAIRDRIRSGMPVLGICAGMVLLSRDAKDRIVGETNQSLLGVLDVTVERNSFGRQRHSFEQGVKMQSVGIPHFPGVFIRSPAILDVGPDVQVLAEVSGRAVAVRQGNIFATSFHPEMTDDTSLHKYFIGMIP